MCTNSENITLKGKKDSIKLHICSTLPTGSCLNTTIHVLYSCSFRLLDHYVTVGC